jgi:hypothetical protein
MDDLQVYQTDDGALRIDITIKEDSIWLNQQQMSTFFETSPDNIGLHLKNIFKDGELNSLSTTEDFSVVRQEGKRNVKRDIKHYNLDAVISVGYRVNSKKATQFRQWATKTIKQHLLAGYTLNEKRLAENATELQKALELVTRAAALPQHSEIGAGLSLNTPIPFCGYKGCNYADPHRNSPWPPYEITAKPFNIATRLHSLENNPTDRQAREK